MSNVIKPTPELMWQLADSMDYDLNNQMLETTRQIILVIQKPIPLLPIMDENIFEFISPEDYEEMDAEYRAKQEHKQKEKQEKELRERLKIEYCKED